jgi:hypothetical protein
MSDFIICGSRGGVAPDRRELGPKAVTCIQPLKFEKVMQVARPEPEIHASDWQHVGQPHR